MPNLEHTFDHRGIPKVFVAFLISLSLYFSVVLSLLFPRFIDHYALQQYRHKIDH